MEPPLELSDLTPEWLSAALSEGHPGTEVLRCRVEDAHAGTTGRAVIALDYRGEPDLPRRLFVKLPPEDAAQRRFVTENGMGRREALFYRRLSAEVPVRVPRCFFAVANDAGDRYVILLENLADGGCGFRNASTRYSVDYVREVLAVFARLHAGFWNSPRFAADLSWVESPGFHPMGLALVERALDMYAEIMPPAFAEMGGFYLDHAPAIHELWSRGAPTLVHGDVHDGNLFYDEVRAEPGFIDWAIVGKTSCMRDVAYFMTGTLEPEDRARRQRELLEFYYAALAEQGVSELRPDELWRQFQWHAAYVWLAGVTTLAMGDEWQPRRYVQRSLERLNRAIADCGSIRSLAEAL